MNADLAQKIVDGTVLFTVDQQPWLQGYGSIDALWQAKRGGFKIGGGQPVLTGPTIVDKESRRRGPQIRPAGRPLIQAPLAAGGPEPGPRSLTNKEFSMTQTSAKPATAAGG